ncbi:nuclear transport factor 2 family protein [Flagellimonas sp. 2504JD1-5]
MAIIRQMWSVKNLWASILLLLLISMGCKTAPQTLTLDQKEELISTIEQFNRAFSESDVPALESMVTENYKHTNGTSKAIDKASWFKYLIKRDKAVKGGELIINTYTLTELDIEYHGHSAIVSGKVYSSHTKDGTDMESEFRITNIWVYQDGSWKRAGFHDGKIN